METKKISFGFTKTKKAEKPIVEEKKDFIECVEEKSIKVIGGEEIKDDTPLIIPMKPNTLITAERLKEIAEKVESALEEPEIIEKPASPQDKPPENETLDQMAVMELLHDSKKEVNVETPALTVPLPAKPVNEGEKESSLDDYEAVPVQDFGLAMLRGMGWAPNKEKSTYKQPQLRPKGLGLGADKVVKGNQKQKTAKDSKGEDLTIVTNAYVKITTGKYSGYYGKIISLDEDMGRVMVDITVKKETVSLSEFMMQPVTKSEFDKESKVINAGSYEEYKKKETLQKSSKNKEESTPERSSNNRKDYKLEKEATSSRSDESKYDRDEKSSRSVDRKYERDERSSRNVDKKNERDEKSSRNVDYKYDKDEKSSRNVDKYDRNEKSARSESKYDRDEKSSRSIDKKYERGEKSSRNVDKYDRDETSSRNAESRYDRDSKSSRETDKNTKNGKGYKDEDMRERDRDRSHRKQRRDSTEESSNRKNKRDSSSESLESLSDSEKKKKKKRHTSDDSSSESDRDKKRKSKKKERRRHDSSDSESDHRSKRNKTPESKRDIDKKRKGKKKKRDRDRSPNYRKHRK